MRAAEKIALRRALEGVRYSLDGLKRTPSVGQIPVTLATARNILSALTEIITVLVDAAAEDEGER